MTATTVEVGQVWRMIHTGEEQRVERIDGDGMIWVRSWAFLNGFPPVKFHELYEPAI